MALGTFDRAGIYCSCTRGSIAAEIVAFNGTSSAENAVAVPLFGTRTTEQENQWDAILAAVRADPPTAAVWYIDGTWIAYEDMQNPLIHFMHRVHPKGSPADVISSFVFDAGFDEDPGTALREIIHRFSWIPGFRTPGGANYAYPIGNRWAATYHSADEQVEMDLDFTVAENVTTPNEHDAVLGMLAWLEELRVDGSGTAFGDDILSLSDLSGRTIRFDQGDGAATLDLEITSIGHDADSGRYNQLGFNFARVSGETDAIDITRFRTTLLEETGTITSGPGQEEPVVGSTEVAIRASKIILPDNKIIEPHGDRAVLATPKRGRTPLDGTGIKIARYADLDAAGASDSDGKLMPKDGSRVVHFGHMASLSTDVLSSGLSQAISYRRTSATAWVCGISTIPSLSQSTHRTIRTCCLPCERASPASSSSPKKMRMVTTRSSS